MIAIYGIKNYKIPASAMIAWCRMTRPGSIIGGQQQYLVMNEKQLIEMGSTPTQNIQGVDISKKDTVFIILGTK